MRALSIAAVAAALTLLSGPLVSRAQDAAQVQPASYRVRLDNDKVRVLEFRARPGIGVCGTGMHSHPAHLTVLLTDAKVRVVVDGKVRIIQQKAGDSFWEPAVTHEVENIGGGEVRALLIEVKSPETAR